MRFWLGHRKYFMQCQFSRAVLLGESAQICSRRLWTKAQKLVQWILISKIKNYWWLNQVTYAGEFLARKRRSQRA